MPEASSIVSVTTTTQNHPDRDASRPVICRAIHTADVDLVAHTDEDGRPVDPATHGGDACQMGDCTHRRAVVLRDVAASLLSASEDAYNEACDEIAADLSALAMAAPPCLVAHISPVLSADWGELAASCIDHLAAAHARLIGRHGGASAAGWVEIDDEDRAAHILARMAEGFYEDLPEADLSGQWADGYSVRQMMDDIGLPTHENLTDEDWSTIGHEVCAPAWEEAFNAAAEAEVARRCRAMLPDPAEIPCCDRCGEIPWLTGPAVLRVEWDTSGRGIVPSIDLDVLGWEDALLMCECNPTPPSLDEQAQAWWDAALDLSTIVAARWVL
jgi:hypothetical protein